MLVNNGYSCIDIDNEIRTTLDKHCTRKRQNNQNKPTEVQQSQSQDQDRRKTHVHKVFYKNHMNAAHQKDEQVLKNILKRNVIPKEGNDLQLMVYYKSLKTSNLVIKNRTKPSYLQETNVVYKYNCKKGDCKLQDTASYIGSTTMTLSRRISYHLSAGGPAEHSRTIHGHRITREDMVNNATILMREQSPKKLRIIEAA